MADRLHIGRASIALLRPEGDGFACTMPRLTCRGSSQARSFRIDGQLSETVDQKRAIYRADIRDSPPRMPSMKPSFPMVFSVHQRPLMSGGRCKGTLNAAASRVDGTISRPDR